ncbi:hypothetical protein GCM10022393_16460 [Aquimarina addita]|uniref:Uncharacterized protein n=1 Tax=Aquimarina addita TaxID=870485 RepID=A0ABP7XGK2_9FLAO
MKTEYILLKEAILTNNCPECYSKDGLTLSFKQEKLHSKLMTKTKREIIEHMNCKTCETTIFPGRWTDDIERTYAYHKKTIAPEPSSIKFTGIFYIILLVTLLIFTAGGFYLYTLYGSQI